MNPNDKQVGGTHYKDQPLQPWDYIAANNIGYFEGNVIKYVSRWKDKGGRADLLKAQHYLEKLLSLTPEVEKPKRDFFGDTPIRMVLCPTCGNKRCPKATDLALDCTNSNEPGQPGSAYVGVTP